jgi:hypothetical protein
VTSCDSADRTCIICAVGVTLEQGCANFLKTWESPQSDMKQVLYCVLKNIRHHHTEFSCHGNSSFTFVINFSYLNNLSCF